MARKPICALTHVRQESAFLDKWIAHYGAIVGRENLHVVLDGDDWEVTSDLRGIQVETVTDAPRQRIRNDRWMAKEMSGRANALRKTYAHVIRGDVDEYVAIDPASGLDWPAALKELGEDGYIFALGIDVVQAPSETGDLDPARPFLGQRRHGFVADRYSKPFVISRWNNWAGGAHRLLNRPVRISAHFVLFHMALCDRRLALERMQARGGTAQHSSFLDHQTLRLAAFDEAGGGHLMPYETARAIGLEQFVREADGSPATRPRPATDPRAHQKGLYTTVPERFEGLV